MKAFHDIKMAELEMESRDIPRYGEQNTETLIYIV